MASFAGNISFKFSCQLPLRVFSIPFRNTWKCQIVCLKSRDFSSSVPGRYIPKTSSQVKKVPNLPDGSVPEININGGKDVHGRIAHFETAQNLNEIQNNFVFDDGEEGIEQMGDVAEEAAEELAIHQGGDSCEQDLINIDRFTNDVEKSAIKLLAARALTAVELRKKLLGKRFSPNTVEVVINKFQRRGLINDRLYAESFSQSRWSSSSWGPRRIKQALFKKGVSQADADKAVEVVFNDNDYAEDQNSVIGLSKHSIDHLCAQASKQWFRGQNVPNGQEKQGLLGGFNTVVLTGMSLTSS